MGSTGVTAWQQVLRPDQVPSQQREPIAARELADGSRMLVAKDGGGVTTVRYDEAGAQLSVAPFYPPYRVVLASIDPFGGVFIAAVSNEDAFFQTSGDIWIMKYDGSTGCQLWAAPAIFDAGAQLYDTARWIQSDANGDLLVTGTSRFDDEPLVTFLALKYDGRSGALLWGPMTVSSVLVSGGAALDGAGNLYASVGTVIGGSPYFDTVKYDAGSGTALWGPVLFPGLPKVAQVDGAGALIVAGESPGHEFRTLKYSGSTGALVWGPSDYSGPPDGQGSSATRLAADGEGNVVVSGFSNLPFFNYEQATLKISGATGEVLWGPAVVAGGNPAGLAIAGNGDPVVTGLVVDLAGQLSPETRRYDRTTGDQLWATQMQPEPITLPEPQSFVGSDGRVFVASSFVTGTEIDVLVQSEDAFNGSPVWSRPFTGAAGAAGILTSVAAGPDGNPVVGGYLSNDATFGTSLCAVKYDRTTGARLWGPIVVPGGASQGGGGGGFLAVDPAGDVLLAGYTSDSQLVLLKYAGATGTPIWGPTKLTYVIPKAIRTDGAGDILIFGFALETNSLVLLKFSGASGVLLWGPVSQPGSYPIGFSAIAVDPAGNPIVTEALNQGSQQVLLKYASGTGALLWGPVDAGGLMDYGGAIASDSAGNIILAGAGGTTAKYDGTTGSRVWGPVVNVAKAPAVAVDSNNDVVVTGYVFSPGSLSDFATVKYRGTDGTTMWGPVYFDGAASGSDTPSAVAIDGAGNAVVCGTSGGPTAIPGIATLKYDGATGATVWGPSLLTRLGSLSVGGLLVRSGSILIGGTADDYLPAAVRPTGGFLITALTESLGIETLAEDVPPAYCGQSYDLGLVAQNGIPGYSWSLVSGSLPTGLDLGADGVLSGAPVEEGRFPFRVKVADSVGASASRDYVLDVVDGEPFVPVATVVQSSCEVELSVPGSYSTYLWLPGMQATPSITVSPNETTTYGIVVTDATGCLRHGVVTVRATRLTDTGCLAPTISSIAPRSGSEGTAFTIIGSNFQPGALPSIGLSGAFHVVVVDSSHISGEVEPGLPPGTVADVFVFNPDTGSATLRRGWLEDFVDVPSSNPFHDDIVTIALNGITAGCGDGGYCPDSPVSRAQVAVLLLRAEHGFEYAPPTCEGSFSDVPCPSPFADWIEQLARENVTAGCHTGLYCPGDPVTRAQMAVFLLKTRLGSGYAPPAASGTFEDVPVDSFAADWIEDLYRRGISGGCSADPPLFCPEASTTRGQMAVFLVKTFELQ